ncbi:basic proline-rich protein-like [Chiroxiphia lanceolata]|uniref:basic proline-rich protein-like n=1 Tax=Chiroxiphia lanceolata TaxID=296741 RepID=UPI0013CEDDE9|nr:basic proline-rich protein-like [Chiroxiphia lanceolata]
METTSLAKGHQRTVVQNSIVVLLSSKIFLSTSKLGFRSPHATRWKTPSFAEGPGQGKHSARVLAITTAGPPPTSQPRRSVPGHSKLLHSSDPPDPGGQQTPERSPRNSLGGGCERCPRGALQAREPLALLPPCPALLVPRKSKCRSSQGLGPLPGGGSAAPAEWPRGPPGRQLLPAQPAWAERDPPAAQRLPQPRGRLCPPPPPRAARSARGETMGTMTSPSSNVRTSGGRRRLPPGRRDTPGPRLPGPLPPGLGPPPRGGSGSEAPLHPSPAATLRAAAAGGGPSWGTPPPPGPSAPPAPPPTHPRYLRVGGRKRRHSARPSTAPRRKRLSLCVCACIGEFNHSYYLMSSRNSLELELILCLQLVVLPLSWICNVKGLQLSLRLPGNAEKCTPGQHLPSCYELQSMNSSEAAQSLLQKVPAGPLLSVNSLSESINSNTEGV